MLVPAGQVQKSWRMDKDLIIWWKPMCGNASELDAFWVSFSSAGLSLKSVLKRDSFILLIPLLQMNKPYGHTVLQQYCYDISQQFAWNEPLNYFWGLFMSLARPRWDPGGGSPIEKVYGEAMNKRPPFLSQADIGKTPLSEVM